MARGITCVLEPERDGQTRQIELEFFTTHRYLNNQRLPTVPALYVTLRSLDQCFRCALRFEMRSWHEVTREARDRAFDGSHRTLCR